MSSGRGGGGWSRRTVGTDRHSAGWWCTVQDGPVRFSNSNSIAAIKEQPGQSRRGKAGTICWWRRRESWEWIGPTVTAESQWPGAAAGSAGVGAATGKRVILLCFFCYVDVPRYTGTVHYSIGRTDWTLPAGGQRFGSSASRSARTVRQSIDRQDKTENGRPLLFICFCCVCAGTWTTATSPTVTRVPL